MPIITDIQWYRGEDLNIRVTMVPPTKIDFWTFAFALKLNYGDVVTLISKTSGAGQISTIDANLGIFEVSIASADTTSLSPKSYVYDIQRTDSGARSVLAVGQAILRPEVQI